MKKTSLQWRITLMTAILIGVTCVSMNSLSVIRADIIWILSAVAFLLTAIRIKVSRNF